jgi:hypothetical protein
VGVSENGIQLIGRIFVVNVKKLTSGWDGVRYIQKNSVWFRGLVSLNQPYLDDHAAIDSYCTSSLIIFM